MMFLTQRNQGGVTWPSFKRGHYAKNWEHRTSAISHVSTQITIHQRKIGRKCMGSKAVPEAGASCIICMQARFMK